VAEWETNNALKREPLELELKAKMSARPKGRRAELLDGTVLSTHISHNSQNVFYVTCPNSSSKYVNYVHVWLLLLTAPPTTLQNDSFCSLFAVVR
jgi:hypothetical protein